MSPWVRAMKFLELIKPGRSIGAGLSETAPVSSSRVADALLGLHSSPHRKNLMELPFLVYFTSRWWPASSAIWCVTPYRAVDLGSGDEAAGYHHPDGSWDTGKASGRPRDPSRAAHWPSLLVWAAWLSLDLHPLHSVPGTPGSDLFDVLWENKIAAGQNDGALATWQAAPTPSPRPDKNWVRPDWAFNNFQAQAQKKKIMTHDNNNNSRNVQRLKYWWNVCAIFFLQNAFQITYFVWIWVRGVVLIQDFFFNFLLALIRADGFISIFTLIWSCLSVSPSCSTSSAWHLASMTIWSSSPRDYALGEAHSAMGAFWRRPRT